MQLFWCWKSLTLYYAYCNGAVHINTIDIVALMYLLAFAYAIRCHSLRFFYFAILIEWVIAYRSNKRPSRATNACDAIPTIEQHRLLLSLQWKVKVFQIFSMFHSVDQNENEWIFYTKSSWMSSIVRDLNDTTKNRKEKKWDREP